MPVHLYGQMAPMKALAELVGEDVAVVEDAAQSQGAAQDGRSAGSFGAAAATSFYPGKNLGAYGDAGAVVTDSDQLADALRALRNHGGVRQVRARPSSASTPAWTGYRPSSCRRSSNGSTRGTGNAAPPPPATTSCCPGWSRWCGR